MRLLVLTTSDAWTPSTRLVLALGAELAARGDVVAVACPTHPEFEAVVHRAFPRLYVRSLPRSGRVAQVLSARRIVSALRPDAVLVHGEGDALLAAVATGGRGAVVRRWRVDEHATHAAPVPRTWRTMLAAACTRLTAWGLDPMAVSWPGPDPRQEDAVSLPTVPMALWIVPPGDHDEHTALALRAAARLYRRHPSLRIVLLGDVAALQSTRVHAAALGLTACVQVASLDSLLADDNVDAAAVWVTAGGDAGAIATLAAMQRRVPVIVPAHSSCATMVAAGTTGFVVTDADGSVIAAELARLFADWSVFRAMGDAAHARAAQLYGWSPFVRGAAEFLLRASRSPRPTSTVRPVRTRAS